MNLHNSFVTIIIANFNGEKYLSTCLRSVLATKYNSFDVLVVDDGSTDNSIQIIKKIVAKDKRVHFLKNSKNIGAAASRNKAARLAKGDILVFLDNDTEVTPLWISEMVKTLLKDKDRGACQSLLIDFEHRDLVQVAGTKIWAATGWGLPIGVGEKSTKIFDETGIIALSAALAVKKEIFEAVGGFDELESIVTEDLDLSWRIWTLGRKVVLSPESIVYHWTKSINMRKNMEHTNEKIYFHLTKNSLISIIKNYETRNVLQYIFSSIFISLGRAVLVYYKRKDISSLRGTLTAFFWILTHLTIILEKRKHVQENRGYHDNDLFDIILSRGSIFSIYRNYFIKTKLL